MGMIDDRLAELGVTLPEAAAPVANYAGWVHAEDLIYTAGQLPMLDGKPQYAGRLGADLSVEEGAAAARLCAINALAQARAALADGDLDRIVRVVKLVGYVNATPDFTDHPQVLNGASDLMVDIFGEKGRHARSAVGVASLPLGVAVELEAVFEVV